MTTGTEPTLKETEWPERLAVADAEFALDKDGDLEIELTGQVYGDRWTGTFLNKDDARKLRDYLNRVLP